MQTGRIEGWVQRVRHILLRAPGRLAAWAWYPTLLGLVAVGEPFTRYDIELTSGLRVFLLAAGIGLTVTVACTRIFGRDRGAAAAAFIVVAMLVATSLDRVVLFAIAIILIALEGWLAHRGALRIKVPWSRVTASLQVVLAIMLMLQVGRVVAVRIAEPVVAVSAAWSVPAPVHAPDMYVILADGHARSDVLARSYGDDTAGLSTTLGSLGFVESPDSHANHVLTRFSLSVLLNGRPLSEMGQDISSPVNETIPFAALRATSAWPLLRSAGYDFTAIVSGYEHLGLHEVGHFVDVGPRNEMEQAMLDGTALGQAIDSLTAGYFHDMYDRTLRELDAVVSMARQPSDRPEFVFAHLPSPHWPMVFQADCSFRPVDGYTRGAADRGYRKGDQEALDIERDQTICIDSLLAKAVGDIVAAEPDAVVIVLSDHGPEERLDWNAPDEPGLGDRFANLFWARTPGKPGLFPDDVTLVNVLPILFNAYLGTQLPLHPDDLWFGPAPGLDHFVPYVPVDRP